MGVFAARLKKLRTDEGLTQNELAPELGISRSTLGMYETGKREPDFETLETIADFFNVDMNYLIGYSDDPVDWERNANDLGIASPNDYDGDPEDYYRMKLSTDDDHERELSELIKNFVNDSRFERLAVSYNLLNTTNKDKVINYTEKLFDIQRLEDNETYLSPVAAHERTDIKVTDQMKKHDDDIMNDDSEWE